MGIPLVGQIDALTAPVNEQARQFGNTLMPIAIPTPSQIIALAVNGWSDLPLMRSRLMEQGVLTGTRPAAGLLVTDNSQQYLIKMWNEVVADSRTKLATSELVELVNRGK